MCLGTGSADALAAAVAAVGLSILPNARAVPRARRAKGKTAQSCAARSAGALVRGCHPLFAYHPSYLMPTMRK